MIRNPDSKIMQNKYNNQTVISVTGPTQGQYLTLVLPSDANIQEWEDAFRTILTHQTFAPKTIDELFFNDATDCRHEEFELFEENWGAIKEYLNGKSISFPKNRPIKG